VHVRWLIPVGAAAASIAHVVVAAQYMTVEQAQKSAFPAATQFVPMAEPDAATAAALGAAAGWSPRIFDARSADAHLGYLIIDQVIGKSELITFAASIDANGAIASVEILEYHESHGGEVRLAGWRKQFVGKTVADPVMLNKDIKNISGATLSCQHLTDGIKRLLKYYQLSLAKV
jgi:Na+-translocating ferredoxin:NAD+ oxidoreductase RnfG subunit